MVLKKYTISALSSLLLCSFISSVSFAVPSWIDGPIVQTQTENCSVSGSPPYQEPGTAARVGYWGETNLTAPKINELYILHTRIEQVGNPCGTAGPYQSLSHVEIFLPSYTALSIDAVNPVKCWFTAPGSQNPQQLDDCPQVLPTGPNGGLRVLANHETGWWPLAQGAALELWFPVRSAHALGGAPFSALIDTNDYANSPNPVLTPTAGISVALIPPDITYPKPSVSMVEPTSARTLALLSNHYLAGTVYWEFGKTTAYDNTSPPFQIIPLYESNDLYSDWSGLERSTTYHWRLRFVAANGMTYIGADQQFSTPAVGGFWDAVSYRAQCWIFGRC